ncbi:MAG: hypothetical protein Q9222_003966 [Ikaeria aurantiellina]
MAEATRPSDALPSISYLDMEKIKREASCYNPRFPSSAAINMPAPPLASPNSFHSGPPPPYSYPSSTASSVVGGHTNGYTSPSTDLRKPNEETEQYQSTRQSLPSIHEALNRDQPLSITSLLSQTGAPPPPTVLAQHNSTRSPTSPGPRPYQSNSSTLPSSTITQNQYSPKNQLEGLQRRPLSPRPSIDNRVPNGVSRESHYPPMLPPRTVSSPVGVSRPSMSTSGHHRSSPPYEPVSRAGPAFTVPQNYHSYSAPFSYPPAPATSNFQPPVSPSVSSWRFRDSDVERSEEIRRSEIRESLAKPSFGEAVKRHLDHFDLETSLNEIAEGSGRALDFSRLYRSQAHQTQRSGPVPGSMPSLAECDEMINYQKRVLDSMHSIKEVIIAQQHALAEQRNYENNYKVSNKIEDDGASFHEKMEGSGGFAGAEAKKRRGVCHLS